jgi:hypothetical protein
VCWGFSRCNEIDSPGGIRDWYSKIEFKEFSTEIAVLKTKIALENVKQTCMIIKIGDWLFCWVWEKSEEERVVLIYSRWRMHMQAMHYNVKVWIYQLSGLQSCSVLQVPVFQAWRRRDNFFFKWNLQLGEGRGGGVCVVERCDFQKVWL